MSSLRSGVAIAAIVTVWSSAAFGFSLFGSDKPAAPTQAQAPAPPQTSSDSVGPATTAKTLAANLDIELDKAKTQRSLGDYTGAARALAQLMLVAPDDPRVLGEYGKVMVAQGRSDDAVAFLKRALELSPDDWTFYSAVGAAFDQKNDYTDARIAYQRGLQLKPGEPALLNNYAMSRMLAGDLPGAQALITQAQAAGNDPKIAHNAALMASLRGASADELAPARPIAAMTAPAATTKPAMLVPNKPMPAPVAAAKPAVIALPKPIAMAATAPTTPDAQKLQARAMPKPVTTAELPPPSLAKAALLVVVPKPESVETASIPAAKKVLPTVQKPTSIAVAKPIETTTTKLAKTITAPTKPQPLKTASAPPAPKAVPATQKLISVATTKPAEAAKTGLVKTAFVPATPKLTQIQAQTPVSVATTMPVKLVKPVAATVETKSVEKPPQLTQAVEPAPTEKPSIIKTASGSVMMQAIPKDRQAGPMQIAQVPETPVPANAALAKPETAEATSAPRALASTASAQTPHTTPDLRAAAD